MRDSLLFVGFCIMLNTAVAGEIQPNHHRWKLYSNTRFEYVICYPADLLIPQGESPNGDGQKFLAQDGAQLIVFGQNNALGASLKDMLEATASRLAGASGKVTYKVLKPSWFVVSGYDDHRAFYAKTRYTRGRFESFEMSYDKSVANVYRPVIDRLATCFIDLAQ
jgi:hypothetical protein